jgi:hypothetical protein
MFNMNTDLIQQLGKLTPTEGEWIERMLYVESKEDWLFASSKNNIELVLLAPTMRIELLAMAKEIERLKKENKQMKDYINPPEKDSLFKGLLNSQRE